MHAIGIARTGISTRPLRQHVYGKVAARAEVKVTGEFNESDGKVSIPASAEKKEATQNADGTYYIDELEVSMANFKWDLQATKEYTPKNVQDMKRKLRKQYVELGGSANTPMANNYFLYIILFIGGLAVSCSILGYI